MIRRTGWAATACGVAVALASVPTVRADDAPTAAVSTSTSTGTSTPEDARPALARGGAKALDTAALAQQRGGTDPGTLSDLKLNGVVGSNNASNLSTGNNTISDGAFAGVNGVPLVVQNSGNNVLIQSATIINVQVK